MASLENKSLERVEFSKRLKQALSDGEYSPDSPTQLAREFNTRFNQYVTVQAARKWLLGEAIPTQERLRALSTWLGVSAEWLRFGSGKVSKDMTAHSTFLQRDLIVLRDLAKLDNKHRAAVVALIKQLVRAQ